ncbi:heavy-metal-associated domain-containing protein [Mitsuokella sp.]|uniref:heavy-metal-associated domain-containing protein n=1 Tax=Mitsuokella sp. TaxID=2049034 RepID=UPI003D7E67AB
MATAIVGVIVLVALYFAFKGVIKHWRGESSCCSGGAITPPPKKELKGTIVDTKIVDIEGMTCGNCKIRVEQALDSIDGAAAEVNLHRNHAVVKMTREVSDDEIRQALAGSGYTITGIHTK